MKSLVNISIGQALQSLAPGAKWVLRGDELEWLSTDIPQPSDAEIEQERARLQYLQNIREYRVKRQYPPLEEQLDKIYHEGLDSWKAEIDAIKSQHPKVVPNKEDEAAFVNDHMEEWRFNRQLREYTHAVERLARYPLAEGRPAITETQEKTDEFGNTVYDEETGEPIMLEVEVSPKIEPLPDFVTVTETVTDNNGEPILDENGELQTETKQVPNPEIEQDQAERAAAQTVIDETPDTVINYFNSENTE